MKKLGKLLSEACIYATLMLFAVLVFAEAFGLGGNGISFARFAAVFGYSLLISIANLIKRALSTNIFIKTSIHYALTLSGFIFLFAFLGNMNNAAPTKIFVAIALFSVFYATIALSVWLVRKYILKSSTPAPARCASGPKGEYTSLYGDNK